MSTLGTSKMCFGGSRTISKRSEKKLKMSEKSKKWVKKSKNEWKKVKMSGKSKYEWKKVLLFFTHTANYEWKKWFFKRKYK